MPSYGSYNDRLRVEENPATDLRAAVFGGGCMVVMLPPRANTSLDKTRWADILCYDIATGRMFARYLVRVPE
jgi:hypothetical protein